MFSMYVSIVTIGNFAIENFNASASTAGLVASIFIVGVLAGRAVSGRQVDRIGAREIMYIGTILFFTTYGLYFIEGGLALLMPARLLSGLATEVMSSSVNTLVPL